jgi:hypothetical protein
MKRIYYLLSVLAVLIPGLVFAITAPSGLTLQVSPTTAPNGYSIQLHWANNGSYKSLQITRQDPNGSQGLSAAISPSLNSYTDTNQNHQWLPANTSAGGGAYIYTVQASQGTDTASTQGSVSMPFADSQIVTVATKTPSTGTNTYTLVCAPLANAVYVGWTANVINPDAGTLYNAPNVIDFVQYSPTVNINGSNSMTIAASNLEGSSNYFIIKDANSNALSNLVGPCGPLSPVSSDAPTQLHVFTNGPTTLYLNWKDNSTSTATSTFEVQRFQVTPAAPSNLGIVSSPSALTLSWTNTPVNAAPFYTLIERSTNANFTANLVSSPVSSTATSYTDTAVQTGNIYYYRVSNISHIPVQSFYQYPTSTNVIKPLAPASGYAIASETYTTYNPPAGLVGFLGQSLNSAMTWLFKAPDAEAQTQQTVNYENYFKTIATTTAPALADTGLAPGTVYMYRVLLVYPNSRTSTPSNMVAGVTLPQSSNASGTIVPICTAYGYCNHNIAGYHSPDNQMSETQCSVNADCRNVGRASQQTQEQ